MDLNKTRELLDELAAFMEKHGLAELEIDIDQAKVKLKKAGEEGLSHVVHHSHSTVPVPPSGAPTVEAPPAGAAEPEPGVVTVPSPMVGTFYRAASPDADPFVEVGDEVEEDTPVCIIEAMKVMNEIKAEHRGRILEILVENGEPVEYGQPLLRIQTEG